MSDNANPNRQIKIKTVREHNPTSTSKGTEQNVLAPEHLGPGACSSEILGIGQPSNVNAITGKHYFINYFINLTSVIGSIIFIPRKSYLLRISCIDPASISVLLTKNFLH